MPSVDDFNDKTTAFWKWLVANGVEISPKVAIHDYRAQNQGRGLRAEEDIQEDEILFTIPRKSVIAVDNDSRFVEFLKSSGEETDPWFGLIAYMMSIQSSDRWKPYFDILPDSFNTPMFWSDEDIERLRGSALIDKIGKKEADNSYHEQVVPLLNSPGASEFFSGDIDTSINAFHRMGSLIMSYGFDIEPSKSTNSTSNHGNDGNEDEEDDDVDAVKAMVPLADILNAHTRLCNAHLCHTDDNSVLEMRSIKKIAKGDQIYNTYGELPNSDLMRRYGYAQAGGTEFDVVEISTDLIIDAVKSELVNSSTKLTNQDIDAQFGTLAKLDQDNDIIDEAYDIPVSGELEPETIMLTLFLQLTEQSQGYKPRAVLESIYNKAQSGELTTESLPILQRAINSRLAMYPAHLVSEIRNDRTPDLSDEVFTTRAKMCQEVLIGEIRILLNCLDWVKDCAVLPSTSIFTGLKKKREPDTGASDPAKRQRH
ncbi:Rkm4p [Sugiyamaella lignohabitans]|uniref:Rkm4p n=1 Tax=Sugiyamaella lignohabitans TaxID=796027 RepID=A0A167CBZ7_9ASCO|nr:Rkm4p [Sugiyamaella lignohabitans]ANB11485.1 Rkm4p [Sugiyamaella lignohabitans]